jgi:hypothetical protein
MKGGMGIDNARKRYAGSGGERGDGLAFLACHACTSTGTEHDQNKPPIPKFATIASVASVLSSLCLFWSCSVLPFFQIFVCFGHVLYCAVYGGA